MKTILVTGANGYIGRHVVSELCRANVEVVTLDTSEQAIDEKVRHVSASVLSPGFRLSDHFESVPDVCVHLA
uniref:NAD-dependent epimerase/dehydratase family protein n=2 Tax=Bacteria TaxID=2 RepID=UPI0034A3D37A